MTVIFSALRAGRPPFTRRKFLGTHFCQRLSQLRGHSAAGSARRIEKYNILIGTRTRDIPPCSIVPQPTTLPRTPAMTSVLTEIQEFLSIVTGGQSCNYYYRFPFSSFYIERRSKLQCLLKYRNLSHSILPVML
jgi:hypothetical protein